MEKTKRFLQIAISYEFLIGIFSCIIFIKSKSLIVIFPVLFATGAVFCFVFMYTTIKAAARGNIAKFPYGTGRLENASAFSLAALFSAGTAITLLFVAIAIFSPEKISPKMGLTTLIMFISAFGNSLQAVYSGKVQDKEDNPIIISLYNAYKTGAVRDVVSFMLLLAFWFFGHDKGYLMFWVDKIAALLLCFYAFYHFLPQVWTNFRDLVDFPLPEEKQILMMSVLTKYFEEYEMIGNIYTTKKGSKEIVEVELEFKHELTVRQLLDLEAQMQHDFQQIFLHGTFRIIPFHRSNESEK